MYSRITDNKKILIVTNMKEGNETVTLPYEILKTLLSNYNTTYKEKTINLRPYESFVLLVK